MTDIAQRLAGLSASKRALLASLSDVTASAADEPMIPRRSAADRAPMSFAQRRLWLLDQIEPSDGTYNVRSAVRIRGPLDVEALRRSVAELARRHEVLRTSFGLVDGEPVQRIATDVRVELNLLELRTGTPAERDAACAQLLAGEAARPFDLARAPLLRATLVALGSDEHVLLLVRHHIINDAASNVIYDRELGLLYRAFRDGTPHQLAPLAVQYADYAEWQRAHLRGDEFARQLAFWMNELRGAPPILELPADRPRPPVQTFNGAVETRQLEAGLAASVAALARRFRASSFMMLLAAFYVLLHRYTGRDDIVVGTPIANRTLPELEPVIGFFINTLALRAQLDPHAGFSEALQRVRELALGAFENQDLPFERLVEELAPERNLSHAPIVNVFFVLQRGEERALELDGLDVSPVEFERTTAKFDLTLHVCESANGLACAFEYNTDLFDAASAARMLVHFERLLRAAVADPDQPIAHLPLLDANERQALLRAWEAPLAPAPGNGTAHELIERTAARVPGTIALRLGAESMTYAQLNARANQIARRLRSAGAGPNVLVGICIGRSLDMIAAVLGVLKSGAAYVPLEPSYPRERLAAVAADVAIVLTQQRLLAVLPEVRSVVVLDADPAIAGYASGDLPVTAGAGDLAYVLYTSGSTGRPKGVAMPHGPLRNLIDWQLRRSGAIAAPRTLQFASLSFDVSFQEIVSTLAAGGTLVVAGEDVRHDFAALLDMVVAERVQRLFLPFAVLQKFVDVALTTKTFPTALRLVVTSGEQLKVTGEIRAFFDRLPGCALDNQYGPTEAHVVSAYQLEGTPGDWPTLPPIGVPIQNARLYVLDELRQPLPVGIPGELYIGGAVLARGYFGRPDLTAERFVADPFAAGESARLYRTGDLVRRRDDGNIEFIGRIDRQVKIRGFRVEPAEVEAALRSVTGIRDAAAVVQPAAAGDASRLVGYIVLQPGATTRERDVRAALAALLPDHMLPSDIVAIDALPLTANGKLDAAALPKPLPRTRAHVDAPPIANPLHLQLIEIWREVLGVPEIGLDDNFFELGGHSLSAVVMMNHVHETFGRRIPVAALFHGPTIASLAARLRDEANSDASERLITVRPEGRRAPLFYLHGDLNGGGYYCRTLARHLDAERPLYVFTPHGASGEPIPASIEAMAAENVAVLKAARPEGPYALAGFCSGGLVAFEMARQLIERGDAVEHLVLIDTGGANTRLAGVAAAARRFSRFTGLPAGGIVPLVAFVASRARILRDVLRGTHARRRAVVRRERVTLDEGFSERNADPDWLVTAWQRRSARYVPGPYSGSMTLFWPADKDASLRRRLTAGWRRVARRADAERTAGDHLSCITRDIDDLGPKFDACLRASAC